MFTTHMLARIFTPFKTLNLSVLAFLMLILSGCGGGDEAVKAAGNTENTFARNSESANNEIAQNGTSDTTACSGTGPSSVTYCVVVEATDSMIASWKTDLFNLITPAKAYAFRGLTTVPARSIEIIQVDENLNRVYDISIPSYSVTENPTVGTYSINFSESPPARIDIVAKVTLDNGQVLLAPFIDSSIDQNFNPIVVVNVVSDYLVKHLFGKLDNAQALDELLPCSSEGSNYGSNIGCKNQPYAKFNLWSALNGVTQSYEIDIPASYTITQALDLLDATGEFKSHIDTILDEIIRTKEAFVGGTEQEFNLNDFEDNEIPAVQRSYNSSLFSLALNQTSPDSSNPGASISTTISTQFEDNTQAGSYPELIRTTSNFNVTVTSLTENFPIKRTSLNISPSNDFSLLAPMDNSITFAPGNTFLTSQGFYTSGKVPFQTITDKNGTAAVGWQSDPYTQLMYSPDADGAGPEGMLSSFVRNGGKFAISANSDATWTRGSQLEEQNMFVWSLYTQFPLGSDGETVDSTGEGFTDTSKIDSNEYGVIDFSVKLNGNGDILTTTGATLKWNANTSSISESQAPQVSLLRNHYNTYGWIRDSAQALSVSAPTDTHNANRNYQVITSSKSSSSGLQDLYLGRLEVSAPDTFTELNQASSTPEGDMITVVKNESTAGQGLMVALEARTQQPDVGSLSGSVYRLAGNSFGANTASNVLQNYNHSTIELTSGTTAILTLNALEAVHNVSNQQVTNISEVSEQVANGTYSVNSQGLIQFTFNSLDLEFTGFMSKAIDSNGIETTEAGNTLTLLMVRDYDDTTNAQATLGLVYGLKELSLDVDVR